MYDQKIDRMMIMIQIEHQTCDGIPLLICAKKSKMDQALPVVTYLHGFTGAKEDNLSIAYLLADKGFRVILPDAHLHGEREDERSKQLGFHFFEIVQQNVIELETIYKMLSDQKLIENNSFSLAGTSMGGISTAAALAKYPWITHAGIMMGTALLYDFSTGLIEQTIKSGIELPISDREVNELLEQLKPLDLSLNIDKLNNRPLFVWHGEKDEVVPFALAEAFHEQLSNDENYTEEITFVTEQQAGHKVSRQARLALVSWINDINAQ